MPEFDDIDDNLDESPAALLALTIRDATAFGITRLELRPDAKQAAGEHLLIRDVGGLMPERREWQVSAQDGAELLRHLNGIQVPMLPGYVMGLDGTTYTLAVCHGLNRVMFTWWDALPDGWEAIGLIVENLKRLQVGPGRVTS